ncbi:phage tail protein [Alcaligenes faecalis]|uniref:phage tail-collar fiber domain-containing protein n=1 Tax=Alcaligenes faecalis TaxID=511 RepID=UPI0018D16FB5|nr:phage tail protein [Alcaligenes faecalis]MBH0311911.1 phage tail protein [Alcaligenes faecalis]
MSEQFYTILTNVGKAKIANAISLGSEVNLVRFVVGDSNGSYYNPTEEQTELRRKVWETNAISVVNDEKNPNRIKIEAIIPGDVGGFTVREVGVFDDKNEMIAIGKIAEIYKPISEDGSTKDVIIRMIIEVSNASAVTIKVDPTVMIATKKDIEVVESKFKKITGDKNELVTKNKSNLVAAINEVATDLGNIGLTGNKVTIEDTDNNYESGTVEGALEELATKDKSLDKKIVNNKDEIDRLKLSVADGKSKIATSVSGKGVPTNGSDSFQTMADNIDSIKTKLPILEGDVGVTEDSEGNVYNVSKFAKRRIYDDVPITKIPNSSFATNVKKICEYSPGIMVLLSGNLYKYDDDGLINISGDYPTSRTTFLIAGEYIYALNSSYIMKHSIDKTIGEIKRTNISIANESALNIIFDNTNNVFWVCYSKGSISKISLDFDVISTFKKTSNQYNVINVDSLGNIYVSYRYLDRNQIDKYDPDGNLLLTKQISTASTYGDISRITIQKENDLEYLYCNPGDGSFMKLDLNLEKVWKIVYSADWGYKDFEIKDRYIYLLSYGSNSVTSFLYIYDIDKNMQNFCPLWEPVDRGVSIGVTSNKQIFISGQSSGTSVILQENYTEIDPGYALIEKRGV